MKVKHTGVIILFLIFPGILLGTQIVPLPDLNKPQVIRVDKDQMYVVEGAQIHIYSLKDLKKKKTFGKKGVGPREFRVHPGTAMVINVKGDKLMVKCRRRVYYFTKSGDYILERKNASHSIGAQPLGDGFAGIEYLYDKNIRYFSINLYDANLNRTKEILRIPHGEQRGQGMKFLALPRAYLTSFATDDDKLFTALHRDLIIDVYDRKGDKLYSIKKDYKRLKVTSAYKEKVVNYFKTDPFHKQFYHQLYHPITFPDYFPVVRDLRAADNKLFVITYKTKNQQSECFIFDTKGKFIKQLFLPLKEVDLDYYPFDIRFGKVYQLVENMDNEEWELHITKIE